MPIDFLQHQPYQLPGQVPLTFTATTGDYVRVWLTDAPTGSKLKGEISKDTFNNRVQMFEGATADIWNVELDKGGAYVFVLQEYQKGGAAFAGGYAGDPAGFRTETKVGGEETRSVYIGERLAMRLGTNSHGTASLVVYVWNDTIRQTTKALHGETTPAVLHPSTATVDKVASKRRAETAALDATVQARIAALINLPVAGLLPSVTTLVAEMIAVIPLHFDNTGGTWHGFAGVPDLINGTEIQDLPTAPTTPEGFSRVARVLASRLTPHMTNESDGSEQDRHTFPDFANAIIAQQASPGSSSMPEVWASIADVSRAYEAHRQSSAVHNTVDTTNILTTPLDPLLVVHRDFLLAMQPLAPAAPATTNPGVTEAAQLGFEPDPR